MPLYRFDLRDGADLLEDGCGTSLDLPAAHEHARVVALELMQNRERESRHCKIEVREGEGDRPLFVVAFATVDLTLDHLDPDDRKRVERFRSLVGDLRTTLFKCAMTELYVRALSARKQRRPYVVADLEYRVL